MRGILNVEDHRVGVLAPQRLERLLAVAGLEDVVAHGLEVVAEDDARVFMVVRHEDRLLSIIAVE